MNILITGAKGFVGKNLCATLVSPEQAKTPAFTTLLSGFLV